MFHREKPMLGAWVKFVLLLWSGYLPSQPIVHLGCAMHPQKLGVRSSEANDELLRAQRNWAWTQP